MALAEAGGSAIDVLDPHRVELVLAGIEALTILRGVHELMEQ
jgi:hypothetical protein